MSKKKLAIFTILIAIILDQVLSALFKAGVKVNRNKCQFSVDCVQYLGFNFDKNGVRPSTEKIRAIIDAPIPKNIKQVQSYLGLG